MNPLCDACGARMQEGPFPYRYSCPSCGATGPEKKTDADKKAAGQKAAKTKKSGRK